MNQHAHAPELSNPQPDSGAAFSRALIAQLANVEFRSDWPTNSMLYPLSSGPMPIAIGSGANTSSPYLEALLELFPQAAGPDLPMPRATNNVHAFTVARTVGDEAEPFIRYWQQLDSVRAALHERRGSSVQEAFMFDVVGPFIEENGIKAIHDIDLTLESMPRSARYFFPYLLGHLEHLETLSERLNLLNKYCRSEDEDVRDGAVEALDHLSAA